MLIIVTKPFIIVLIVEEENGYLKLPLGEVVVHHAFQKKILWKKQSPEFKEFLIFFEILYFYKKFEDE